MYRLFYQTLKPCPIFRNVELVGGDMDSFQLAGTVDEAVTINDILDDVTTIMDKKWPKINDTVTIPFTFPSSATKQDKADIARVVKEFESKTCIR